jgi:hypothetical protein
MSVISARFVPRFAISGMMGRRAVPRHVWFDVIAFAIVISLFVFFSWANVRSKGDESSGGSCLPLVYFRLSAVRRQAFPNDPRPCGPNPLDGLFNRCSLVLALALPWRAKTSYRPARRHP